MQSGRAHPERAAATTDDSPTIELAAGDLGVRVRPHRGFEICSITVERREILASVPWDPGPVIPAADEVSWTRAWQGGWQILTPSSGAPCSAEGVRQGFHGNASQAPWTTVSTGPRHALGSWHDNAGLHIDRTAQLDDSRVRVDSTARNLGSSTRHLIATEHLIFGCDLLADPVTITADGEIVELHDSGEVRSGPKGWPADGWDRVAVDRPAARFAALRDARTNVRLASSNGLGVTVRWERSVLPHAWFWQEIDSTTASPWSGRQRALGIEPSMTVEGTGLAAAIRNGTARPLAPGEHVTWYVEVWPALGSLRAHD